MKRLLIALAFLWSMPAFSQEIVIAKESLTINGSKVTSASTYANLVKLLGKPEREDRTEEGNSRLSYGSGRLQVYFSSTASPTLKTIIMKPEPDSTGETVFAGTLFINEVSITANTDRNMIASIPGVQITEQGDTGIDANVEVYNVSFYYGESATSLKRVEIHVDNEEED
ncbi:hypothetical protein [Polluticoccus soli]|uniref:DUF7738 domain-containing protein n=1 Tax=Polluticoccus soli TaxID=3034150 RepID=UPI0023E15553|nr:hypothetical protein [Flavipsychrobacter sp. JY13-12]